ncbi:MAG: TIGR04563 family protein [Proteobacteria bacterium]|nr:TIGR04563 family protein [Pseudomonadota bacterium]
MATKQKLTLYFPPELLEEARNEAARQERTVSWILQKAWEFARQEIHKMPGADDPLPAAIARLAAYRKTAV